jgi:predicted RNase H-like HicB family nuclease
MEGSGKMRYLVVVERTENNYSAYVPDLPGCIATGATAEDVQQNIREAIALHMEGLREDGLPVPAPQTQAEFVEA